MSTEIENIIDWETLFSELRTVDSGEMLAAMMVENTGVNILDSGGAYGRAYEKHQKQVGEAEVTPLEFFTAQPKITVDTRWPSITASTFHFWKDRLEYCSDIDGAFYEWMEARGTSTPWIDEMDGWLEMLGQEDSFYLEDHRSGWINTYNGESLLSDGCLIRFFTVEDVEFIALSIHGGCDIRGGYTMPRIFRAWEEDHLDWARLEAYADTSPAGTDEVGGDSATSYNAGYSFDVGHSNSTDNDDRLCEAFAASVELNPEDPLPVDDQHVYVVHNHPEVEDGFYFCGILVEFEIPEY